MSNISHIILASSSPRRQQLMKEAGIAFEVRIKNTDEVYPSELKVEDIPVYLAQLKEWIGYVGIERIDGSFYNVMGLPVQTLYRELKAFGLNMCE